MYVGVKDRREVITKYRLNNHQITSITTTTRVKIEEKQFINGLQQGSEKLLVSDARPFFFFDP